MTDEKKEPGGDPSEPESSVPEVEAEIVDDDAVESAAADDGGGEDETAPSPDETTAEPAGKAGRRTFTPGVVLFLAFAALALVAFAVWRLQGGNVPAEEAETALPTDAEDGAPADEPPAAAQGDPATDDDAPPGGEEAGDETAEAAPPTDDGTPASKIANDAAATAKDAGSDIDPVVDVPTADDTFLPPLPGEETNGGNQALQDAAKEAARQFGEEAEESAEQQAPSDAIEGFEFDSEATPGAGDADAPEAAGPAGDAAAASEMGSAKIDNTALAALKDSFRTETQRLTEALAEERRRTAALNEEVAAMRRDFEAALAARNERMGAEIADLRDDIEKIRNGEDLTAAKRAAGAAATNALEAAVKTGRPYEAEFAALQKLAPDAPELSALGRHAEDGAPRLETLKESFPAAAREGLAAAGRDKSGEGFLARLGARAKSLVSVRPAEPQTGTGPRAVISRAEAAVEAGDLARALQELDTLPAGAREAMADWIESARAYVEVERALQALSARFLDPQEG